MIIIAIFLNCLFCTNDLHFIDEKAGYQGGLKKIILVQGHNANEWLSQGLNTASQSLKPKLLATLHQLSSSCSQVCKTNR